MSDHQDAKRDDEPSDSEAAASKFDDATVAAAISLTGLTMTAFERDLMHEKLHYQLEAYEKLRTVDLPNCLAPALRFDPEPAPAVHRPTDWRPLMSSPVTLPDVPENLEDLAFLPVTHLSALVRARRVTSQELTSMYIERLKRIGPELKCVVTMMEDQAMAQAARADAEIAAGMYRGPLHGIPWGAKDLLATKGVPTTWGAPPYREQVFDYDATVVRWLDEAGAVLVAKLSMGSLAWADVWFGGRTRSPWNLEEGASGSSAGSGAATAAGLVGFAIGTETHGSIVSPSTECGVTGLRPTFGRVSRYGAMALCWSLDKIGPMCRSVEDCALVFDVIRGPDGRDATVVDYSFPWAVRSDLDGVRIGYVAQDFEKSYNSKEQDQKTLATLRDLGAELTPITLPDYPLDAMLIVLYVEAAAAFDELTRSDRDDELVRQGEESWPNRFRAARLVPAVEYVQANRLRTLVMQELNATLSEVDLYVAPSREGDNLWLTNATGHPAVVLPNGFRDNGLPSSITFTGRLHDEATLLAVAKVYQDATDFHTRHPSLA